MEDDLFSLIEKCRSAETTDEQLACLNLLLPRIEKRIFGFVADFDDPKEILQLTLIKIAAKIHRFKGAPEGFWKWARQVALNVGRSEYRKTLIRRKRAIELAELFRLYAKGADEPDESELGELEERAMAGFRKLAGLCQRLLSWSFVDLMSLGEIAERTGEKYDTVRMRVSRCLKSLKRFVNE